MKVFKDNISYSKYRLIIYISFYSFLVVERVGLEYRWAVFKDGSQDFTIENTNKQFDKFSLAPYTLEASSVYTFTLAVFDPKSSLASKDSVVLNIVRGNVVAVISFGATKGVLAGGELFLDASTSFDSDKAG
jgi:uncharacterized protein YozE (UPF0346 family)